MGSKVASNAPWINRRFVIIDFPKRMLPARCAGAACLPCIMTRRRSGPAATAASSHFRRDVVIRF